MGKPENAERERSMVINGRLHTPDAEDTWHVVPISMDEARDKAGTWPRYKVKDGAAFELLDGGAGGMTPMDYVAQQLNAGVKSDAAVKSEPVLARKAIPGEIVTTWAQNGTGAVKQMAGPDTYVLTKTDPKTGGPMIDADGHDNSWVIKKADFEEHYAVDPEAFQDGGLVQPKDDLRIMLPVGKNIALQTSWGELQHIEAGGYLNITKAGDIYGISAEEFAGTHAWAPDAAKFIGKGEDNPYWALKPNDEYDLGLAAELDEDGFDYIMKQADALGAESLTENQQFILDVMKRSGVEQAWDYLDQTGAFEDGKPPHEVDTGRYLRIEFPAGSDNVFNAYESVPTPGDPELGIDRKHVFWNLDVARSEAAFTADSAEFRTVGVYEGKPFQTQRDLVQKEIEQNGYGLEGDMYQQARDTIELIRRDRDEAMMGPGIAFPTTESGVAGLDTERLAAGVHDQAGRMKGPDTPAQAFPDGSGASGEQGPQGDAPGSFTRAMLAARDALDAKEAERRACGKDGSGLDEVT